MESAWIHELDEEDDRSRASGRFRVALRGPAGGVRTAGVFALDEAVRFGREQAPRVYVDVNDTRYTAGSEPDDAYPAWPEDTVARPRPLGTPLDGSVQRIPWLIQGRIRVDGDAEALAEHVEDCLHAADEALSPAVAVRSNGLLYAEFEVEDRGARPARLRASALLDRIVGPTPDGEVELVAWTSSPDVLRRYIR
jgi:hypothetical protein